MHFPFAFGASGGMVHGENGFLSSMDGLHRVLTPLDWLVFGGVAFGIWLLPLLWRRRGADGAGPGAENRLSWMAAGLALVANDAGGAALLAIPALTASISGDFTVMQWALGAWLARLVLLVFWIGPLFREGGGDPFVFIERRLGGRARRLAEWLGFAGTLLVQTVPFLALWMLLSILTPLSGPEAVATAGAVVILWGVIAPVPGVGRDLLIFGVAATAAAGLFVLLCRSIEGGWEAIGSAARAVGTFDGGTIDKGRSVDPKLDPFSSFSIWIALLAVPFQQLQSLATGALARRTLARCAGVRQARLAVLFSAVAPAFVWLLLALGTSVFVFYAGHPPEDPSILRALEWSGGGPGAAERALPVWILTEAPEGWKGALLAAIALSTLLGLDNSFHAGSLVLRRGRAGMAAVLAGRDRLLAAAVVGSLLAVAALVVAAGAGIDGSTWFERGLDAGAWCGGPVAGVFLVSLLGRARPAGLIGAVLLALGMVLCLTPGACNPPAGPTSGWNLPRAWLWPITALTTVLLGCDFRSQRLQKSK